MASFILNEEAHFKNIIGVLLNNWSPLTTAIQLGMGGSSTMVKLKIIDLIKNIYDCLQEPGERSHWREISDVVEDVMDVGFDVELESNSADDIGKHINRLYREWIQSIDGRKKVICELKNSTMTIPIQLTLFKQIYENPEEEGSSSSE